MIFQLLDIMVFMNRDNSSAVSQEPLTHRVQECKCMGTDHLKGHSASGRWYLLECIFRVVSGR